MWTASASPATSPATEAPVRAGLTARVAGRRRRRGQRANPLGALAGGLWLLIVVVPLYWAVVTSLRDQTGFFEASPLALPTEPTLGNYLLVWDAGFVRYLANSVIVTVVAVGLTLAASILAAYAIVRGTSRSVRLTFQFLLLGLAIPQQATVIPIYYLITRMRLYDSLTAIILPSVAFAIPLTVLILVNFLRDVPRELFDAMRVDGAGDWRTLWSLVLPLTRPAVITVVVYDALQVWNGFLFPLILTQSPDRRVLPLSLWSFQGEFRINVPAILAAVVLATLPILTLYVVGRRYLVSGLTAGFGK